MFARERSLISGTKPTSVVAVVFSKDRPLQLDATLTSLRWHCLSADGLRVRVLYTTSSASQTWMYRILAAEHPDVEFVREKDFRRDVIDLSADSEHLLFLVDDTMIVRHFDLGYALSLLDERPLALGVSLRLGRNLTYSYTLDRPEILPEFDEQQDGVLEFSWPGADADFGYPIEVSSSIYRSSDLGPLLSGLDYRNPNTLEAELARNACRFEDSRPRLLCLNTSAAFSIPANLVQDVWQNRISGDPDTSARALAERYGRGERLAVASYDGFTPTACHQEVPFVFETRTNIPTVSIVVPCYGQAEFLSDAVESVVDQSFSDWEVVIVDDGSRDNTAEVSEALINRYPDRRIRLIRQANEGLARARNAGVLAATGRYILPLDADDTIAPEMLESTVSLLETDRTASIAYTDWECFGQATYRASMREFDPIRLPEQNQFAYCALYRREVWESVGGYSSELPWGYEDWDFWIGAVERGYTGRRIPEPLFRYRIRPGSMFSAALQRDDELKRLIRARHPGMYTPWARANRFAARALSTYPGRLRRALAHSMDRQRP